MSGKKNNKYSNEFKQTIVNLYHSGKTYSQIHQEYGISHSALANWIKQYSEVQIDDNTVLTARQIKELQKRNAQLEEENLILKKAIAIFTLSSQCTSWLFWLSSHLHGAQCYFCSHAFPELPGTSLVR